MKSGQRTHRERGQLSGRKHLGNLEKHKDYVLRAKDFHKKKTTIKNLKKKAYEKNPDEFYFGMINNKLQDGVHVKKRESSKKYTDDEIKLMKTQDVNYLNYKQSTESKKIEKMKKNLHFTSLADSQPRTHIFFVDSKKEEKKFDAAKQFNTLPELLDRSHNIPTIETLGKINFKETADGDGESAKTYEELSKRIERKTKLETARDGLIFQRKLMGKGNVSKRKSKEGDAIYEWKPKRKR